jgi:hypothetical protein
MSKGVTDVGKRYPNAMVLMPRSGEQNWSDRMYHQEGRMETFFCQTMWKSTTAAFHSGGQQSWRGSQPCGIDRRRLNEQLAWPGTEGGSTHGRKDIVRGAPSIANLQLPKMLHDSS